MERRRPARTGAAGEDGALAALESRITSCRACPRLVAWRESVAASPRRSFAGERYWARPLAGWGDPAARLLVVGLAPAAHGGNRTGRMFTGDRAGDFLVAGLYRAGFANQPTSVSLDDGLRLDGAFITAAVRCAPPDNRPEPDERRRCAPYLAEEVELLTGVRVVLALGALAMRAVLDEPSLAPPGRRPRFAHGLFAPLAPRGGEARLLACSYHPSQRNVFTGLLTEAMFDAVLREAALEARR